MSEIVKTGLPEVMEDNLSAAAGILSAPRFDPADYLEELKDFDFSEAQKQEFLVTMWSIAGSFARMGFSIDVCGLIFEGFNEASAPRPAHDTLIASTDMETPSNDAAREALLDE